MSCTDMFKSDGALLEPKNYMQLAFPVQWNARKLGMQVTIEFSPL